MNHYFKTVSKVHNPNPDSQHPEWTWVIECACGFTTRPGNIMLGSACDDFDCHIKATESEGFLSPVDIIKRTP